VTLAARSMSCCGATKSSSVARAQTAPPAAGGQGRRVGGCGVGGAR
jgi:hypothetical protein